MYISSFPSVNWLIAVLAGIPYLLFTSINYVDYPLGSGNNLEDSAFCALLDINITPQVKKKCIKGLFVLYRVGPKKSRHI